MAYASPFDTIVSELTYKLFMWTLDLRRGGYKLNFILHEFQHINQIDLEFTVRDLGSNLLDIFWMPDLDVDIGLIHHVTNMLNSHLVQYGCTVE